MSLRLWTATAAMVLTTYASPVEARGYAPKAGFVPDEQTAMTIAEAILVPIMGRRELDLERPLRAELRGRVWIVSGHLDPETVGGVAVVRIDKMKGTILHFEHGQ